MTNEREKNVLLDDKFFEEVLHRGVSDETISNVMIKSLIPATKKGDNFMSQMLRCTLKYSSKQENGINGKSDKSFGTTIEKEISLIVKMEPEGKGLFLENVVNEDHFGVEIRVFQMILPKMEKLLGRSISPKCLHAQYSKTGRSFIVLEDLAPLGFAIKNRQKGLSLPHVITVLDTIASFHAASVVQHEQNPDITKSFTTGLWSDAVPKNIFRTMEQTLRMVSNKCRNWPNPEYKKISDKLRILEDKFEAEILDASKYDDTEFCVLNHGDCWVNNIMFREDENGKPLEVRLVDFQLSVYSSPVIDLIYFLNTCPSIEIENDCEAFFKIYLQRLKLKMRTLGCKTQPPTIEELCQAAMKRRMYTVMSGLIFHPRMLADASEIESLEELVTSGVTRMNIFKNPAATIALQRSLLFMNNCGYLD